MSGNSQSREFLGILASNSRPESREWNLPLAFPFPKMGMEFSICIPVPVNGNEIFLGFPGNFPFPKVGNGIFYLFAFPFPKMGMEFAIHIHIPVPENGNGICHFPFPFPKSKSHSRSPLSQFYGESLGNREVLYEHTRCSSLGFDQHRSTDGLPSLEDRD